MSFYAPEASLINYRICVASPNAKTLASLFEEWAMQMDTEFEPKHKSRLKFVFDSKNKVSKGAKGWLSATIGTRGSLGIRISFVGYDLSTSFPDDDILRRMDALWAISDPKDTRSSEILRLGKSTAPIEIPSMLVFLDKKRDTFDQKALSLWAERNTRPCIAHYGREKTLQKGLEWALSFS